MKRNSETRTDTIQSIDQSQSIRYKLYGNEVPNWKRYALLVTGDTSIWKLIKYEIIVLLFGSIPGALGLTLRRIFYSKLFEKVGRGVVFGRDLTIRNAGNIKIGDRVVIDDQVVLDARGAGKDGIIIGHQTVLNRDVIVIAKFGGIHIGSNTDVGGRTMIISTGGIRIGNYVAVAGNCKIGGSGYNFEDAADGNRNVKKYSKGLIQIDDHCTIFTSAMIFDGVNIKRGSVIGPNIVLRDDVEENTVVAAHQKLVHLPLDATLMGSSEQQKNLIPTPEVENMEHANEMKVSSIAEQTTNDPKAQQAILDAVYAAVDELNLLRSSENQIIKQMDADLSELDSMALVNLIVETEQKVKESLGITINLYKVISSEGGDAFRNLGNFIRAIQVVFQNRMD